MKLQPIRNVLLASVLVFAGVAQAQSLEAAQAGSAAELSSPVSVPISFSALGPSQGTASPAKELSGSLPGEGMIAQMQNGQVSCPEGSVLVEVENSNGSVKFECQQYQVTYRSFSLDAPISFNGSLLSLQCGVVGATVPGEVRAIGESLVPIDVPAASLPAALPSQPPTVLVPVVAIPGL